jgi:asparagine synthase (glutamine-hydrolysing)
MLGIAGYVVDSPAYTPPPNLIDKMAAELAFAPAYRCATQQGDGYALVCADNGLLDSPAQAVWNEDRTLCMAMAGEIFGYHAELARLAAQGHRFAANSGAEFALHLYEEIGDEIALHLNGGFAAAIYNTVKGELLLFNGRLGVRPLYFAHHHGRFVFASRVGALLTDPQLPRRVDPVAIGEALSYEYILNQRTLLQDVEVLPPGSLLKCSAGEVRQQRYWRLEFCPNTGAHTTEEFTEGLLHYLRQAVERQLPGGLPAGVNLSGGLDSRVVFGLLNEQRLYHPLRTYTFGIPGCDDARYASEVARTRRIEHQFFELSPDYLIEQAETGVRMTDGMQSLVHMHALAHIATQAQHVKILYTGYMLDSIITPDSGPHWLAHYNDQESMELLHSDIKVGLRRCRYEDFFTESFWHQAKCGLEQSFWQAAEESRSYLLSDWQNRMELLQRQRRFTQLGNELLHTRLICRTPFIDNDLVDYCLALPPGLRLERRVLREMLARFFPALAKIPWDKTGYPLMPCLRDVSIRLRHHAKWALINAHLWPNRPRPLRPYADYNRWLRHELRPWAEGILLDQRTLARGYFQPQAVRKLLDEQMAGANYAKELGMLLSIELWHRIFLD